MYPCIQLYGEITIIIIKSSLQNLKFFCAYRRKSAKEDCQQILENDQKHK